MTGPLPAPDSVGHPQPGRVRRVRAGVSVLLADNPSPMTLDGTNTFLLSAGVDAGLIVLDPGPDDDAHLAKLAAQGRVELVLITHRHADHTAGAARFSDLTGAPVRAADPAHCHRGGQPLVDGELITAARVRVRVLTTPGHTQDSVCFHLEDDDGPGAMLTGDTILGRGTTVIAHPDGDLASYLDSLDRLAAFGPALVLPAHGPERPDLAAVCAGYTEHRRQRLESVRAALLVLGAGAPAGEAPVGEATVGQVTDMVYTDIEPHLRPAAELSVAAQLQYLRGRT